MDMPGSGNASVMELFYIRLKGRVGKLREFMRMGCLVFIYILP